MSDMTVLDIRGACWLRTAGVGQHLDDLAVGNTLKVVFDAPLREKLENLVAEENCEILQLDEEDGVLDAVEHELVFLVFPCLGVGLNDLVLERVQLDQARTKD